MAVLAFSLPAPGKAASFALSKDGGVAAAVCGDQKLRVWSLPQTKLRHNIDLTGREIDVMAMSGDGRWIVTGDHQGAVTVWNSSSGQNYTQLRMLPYPWPAVFSRDGARIATVDGDCVVRIYDAANGKLLARNDDWLMEPLAMDFTADGRHVVVGGGDKVTAYIDTATGKLTRRMDRDAEPPVSLQFSVNGKYLAVVFFKADDMLAAAPVTVWDGETGRKTVEWMPPALALGTAWTDDERLLVGIAARDVLQIWRVWPAG